MADDQKLGEQKNLWDRLGVKDFLAVGVTITSIAVICVLGVAIIYWSSDKSGAAGLVFNAALPLLGTWVGTIIAHYFSKESFEAATKSMTEMTKTVTSLEKLKATLVKDKMIPFAQMFFKKQPESGILLVALLNELTQQNKGNRVPILTQQNHPAHVIHRSTIDRFLADKACGGAAPAALQALTLQDVLNDANLQKWTQKSFVTVALDSNLAQAKEKLDAVEHCQDVFVTQNGGSHEPVVGWITNVEIEKNSKV